MYSQYEQKITQLEAEEGISELFDFIKDYQRNIFEGNFYKIDIDKFHENKEKIEVIFTEHLDLNNNQSEKLFNSYCEHYTNAHQMQKASDKYFEIEEKIQECVDKDAVAKFAFRGIRDYYAQSVKNPSDYNGI